MGRGVGCGVEGDRIVVVGWDGDHRVDWGVVGRRRRMGIRDRVRVCATVVVWAGWATGVVGAAAVDFVSVVI